MPDSSELRITDGWLLGFTEGDGPFFVERRNYQLGYSGGLLKRGINF